MKGSHEEREGSVSLGVPTIDRCMPTEGNDGRPGPFETPAPFVQKRNMFMPTWMRRRQLRIAEACVCPSRALAR